MQKRVLILPVLFLVCVFMITSCKTNSTDSISENNPGTTLSDTTADVGEDVFQEESETDTLEAATIETNSDETTENLTDMPEQSTEPSETEKQTTAPPANEEPTTDISLEEAVAQLSGIKSFGTGMFLDPSDPNSFAPLIYTGGDFSFYYQITAGEFNAEYGLGFMLNGIYQDFRIEGIDMNTSYSTMHAVRVPAETTKVFKIYLRPNIGHTGDVLKFTNASIVNPSAMITNSEDVYDHTQLNLSATLSSPFTMQSDSTNTASVCESFSGEAHTTYNKNIKNSFRDINSNGELCQILIGTDVDSMVTYNSKDRSLTTEQKITVSRAANTSLKIVLGGGKYGTTQRISLYVNGKIIPVFDGKAYADVTIDNTNQTELTVSLDTSSFPEWNNIYLLAYTMDDSTLVSPVSFVQSAVYVLRVEG